jgi:NADPH-dependent curcumin reductase CurA
MRVEAGKLGETMVGEQLCEVISTRNGQFPLGSLLLSKAGWTSHFISSTGNDLEWIQFDLGSTPKSYLLGTLGMPGATAYIGLMKTEPKKGETVLVSSCASAVGNVVAQIAQLKGCKVIGMTGSDEKVNWCLNDLSLQHVFNYKKENFSDAIQRLAPDGIDIYFDNVGGDFYHTIINKHMKKHGRVLVCGSTSTYSNVCGGKIINEASTVLNETEAAKLCNLISVLRIQLNYDCYFGLGRRKKLFFNLKNRFGMKSISIKIHFHILFCRIEIITSEKAEKPMI